LQPVAISVPGLKIRHQKITNKLEIVGAAILPMYDTHLRFPSSLPFATLNPGHFVPARLHRTLAKRLILQAEIPKSERCPGVSPSRDQNFLLGLPFNLNRPPIGTGFTRCAAT
jgi:hypothetical protein